MPWRLVLLWLCIALLPLRGWALGLPPGGLAPASGHGMTHAVAAPTPAPCHGAPASSEKARHASHHGHEEAQATAAGHAAPCPAQAGPDASPGQGTCAFCDVCHAAAALPPLDGTGFEPRLPAAPPAWLPRPSGRLAVHELFRPPRG